MLRRQTVDPNKESCGEMKDQAKISSTNQASNNQMIPLSDTFQPGPMDVICAKGKVALNHSGNQRFREMIRSRLEDYSNATSRLQKSFIVSEIVNAVRQASPCGGFIKQKDRRWYEVGDHIAREKTGQW